MQRYSDNEWKADKFGWYLENALLDWGTGGWCQKQEGEGSGSAQHWQHYWVFRSWLLSKIVHVNIQAETYAWSVIKICLHRSWRFRFLKKAHLLIKSFHVKMNFHPKLRGAVRGLEETGASEAAVYSPVRRENRWQLALTPASPQVCELKPANLAPSYCPTFCFKTHQPWRNWWSLLIKSKTLTKEHNTTHRSCGYLQPGPRVCGMLNLNIQF